MSNVTIEDVAGLAGVSIKTVSRVVNKEPNVSESTREKVEHAIDRLNYRPNQSARNLASHHSHLIGLIYDDPSAYDAPSAGYVIRLQQGALKACRSGNHELLIHPCRYGDRNVGAELRALIEQARPDGIVVAAPLSNMPKIARAIAATGTPFVRLSPGNSGSKQFAVVTNDREISAEMTRYLAGLGHRRIAFIKGDPNHKAVGNRFLGYREGLEQTGLTYSESLVADGENSLASGEAAAGILLGQKRRPTAIFAANDDMAAGVIRMADRKGIRVPADLSVAGCDDVSLARQVYPALTTVRQPLSSMAERAVRALIHGTNTGEMPKGLDVVPAVLIIRESTGPAPD